MNSQTLLVYALVERIKPLLAGHAPEVQGAVLADLVAIWLAGHMIEGNAEATREMRAALLAIHSSMVRQLTEIN